MRAATRHWLLVLVSSVAVTGTLVTGQLLLARPGWRLDLTPEKRYVLSEHARRVLADLDREVHILAFLRSEDPNNRQTEDLLSRVAAASPRIRTRVIDVNRYPAVARRYGVDIYGAVVVECEGRSAQFAAADEQTLLAAIVQLVHPARRTVYFVTGHGERSVFDRDRRSGYSQAHISLVQELYRVTDLRLDDAELPADAAALVIAGPRADLGAAELARIDRYVRAGGGLLALLDPGDSPSLVALLGSYGIDLPDEIVLDSENRLFAGDDLTMLVPGVSREHPVTAPLEAVPLMSEVRPAIAAESASGAAGASLLTTGPESWRTRDFAVLRNGTGRFVAGRDEHGPVAVGAQVLVHGETTRPGRVLVYGDSDFVANPFLEYLGNRDLFLNSVNWLAGEEALLASRPPPKVPGMNQLFISQRQGRMVFLLGTVAQPAAVLLIGLVVVLLRRAGADGG
jgi:ABC-type uncharacterized transport system involved in gliding motility auxiliary subunit